MIRIYCTSCRTPNPSLSQFCVECGHALRKEQPTSPTTPGNTYATFGLKDSKADETRPKVVVRPANSDGGTTVVIPPPLVPSPASAKLPGVISVRAVVISLICFIGIVSFIFAITHSSTHAPLTYLSPTVKPVSQFVTSMPDAPATAQSNTITAQVIANVQGTTTAQTVIAQQTASQAIAVATSMAQTQSAATARAVDAQETTRVLAAQSTANAIRQVTATAQNAKNQADAWASNAPIIYGPASGTISQHAQKYVDLVAAQVHVRSFVAEAKFYNPYNSEQHSWDYGFFFRETGSDYRLILTSYGIWELRLDTATTDKLIASGNLVNFDKSANGNNTVRLVVRLDKGFFFVNRVYVATLDLLGKMEFGDVFLITGGYNDDEIAGKTLHYENFTVWSVS